MFLKSLNRWWKIAIFVTAGTLLATPTLASRLLASARVQAKLREFATKILQSELGMQARFDTLSVQWFPPAIATHDITLDHPEYGRFAEAKKLVVTPALLEIFRGRTRIDLIDLQRAKLKLVVRDGKVLNLPIPKSKQQDEAIEVPFNDVVISDSRIEVEAGSWGSAVLSHIDMDVEMVDSDVAELRVIATGGNINHRIGVELIRALEIRARVSPRNITLHRGTVATPFLWFSARSIQAPLPWQGSVEGQLDGEVDLAHLHALPLDLSLPTLHGKIAFRTKAKVTHGIPEATGRVRLEDTALDGFGLGKTVRFNFRANRQKVHFSSGVAEVVGNGGEVHFSGTLGLRKHLPLKTRASVKNVEFARVMEQLNITPDSLVSFIGSSEVELRGTCAPFSLSGHAVTHIKDFVTSTNSWLDPPRKRILGVEQATVSGKVSVDSKGWRFIDNDLVTENSKLKASALLGFDNKLEVSAVSDHIDLEDISPLFRFPVTGHGKIGFYVKGTFSDPKLRWHYDLLDTSIHTYAIGDLKSLTDGYLSDDLLVAHFPKTQGSTESSSFTVDDFTLDFSRGDFAITSSVQTKRLAVSDLAPIIYPAAEPQDFSGYIQGQAEIRYTMGFAEDSPNGTLSVAGNLQLESLDLLGIHLGHTKIKGSWRWLDFDRGIRSNEFEIEQLVVRKGLGTINLSGSLKDGGKMDLLVVADQLDLMATEPISERIPQLGGSYSVLGRMRGTFDEPDIHIALNTSEMTWSDHLLGDGQVTVRHLSDQHTWLQTEGGQCSEAKQAFRRMTGGQNNRTPTSATFVCGELWNQQVQLDLLLANARGIPVRGALKFHTLRLDPFLPQREDNPLFGSLTGSLRVDSGTLRGAVEAFDGRVEVQQLRLGQFPHIEFKNRKPILAKISDNELLINEADFVGPGSKLRLAGTASMQQLALTLTGTVSLSPIAAMTAAFSASEGYIALDKISISGKPNKPSLFGMAHLVDGNIELDALGFPIQRARGTIEFNEKSVILRDAKARAAGGTVEMAGQSRIHEGQIKSLLLSMQVKDLQYQIAEGIQTRLNANDLQLTWQEHEALPLLRGRIEVEQFSYTKSVRMGQTLREISQAKGANTQQYDPAQDKLRINLIIAEQQPMVVDNNLLRARLKTTEDRPLRLVGTDQRFGIVGGLVFTRGKLYFRNNEFEIRSGVVEFEDKNEIRPRFDVQAVTEIRRTIDLSEPRWRVYLHAYGDSKSFVLKTTSEPELPPEDILLLLTVGMTRSEAEQLQAGQLTQSAALEALTSVTGVDREVKKVIEIDEFALTSGYSPRTNRTSPQVTIGKRVTNDVRLRATTGLSESREYRTTLEWQTGKRTSVQAVYDNFSNVGSNLGNLGVDVRWRLEFE